MQTESLYNFISSLGSCYPVSIQVDTSLYEDQISSFNSRWIQYNPRKQIPRYGLSLVSLDGGLAGAPDLDSLYEYNRENGTNYSESSFRTPTEAFKQLTSIASPLSPLLPYLYRSHILKFNAGGYFPPHRDNYEYNPDSFRLLSVLMHGDDIVITHKGQNLKLNGGRLYFLDTRLEHSVFAFSESHLLVLNVELSKDSVDLVKSLLVAK